MESRDVSRQDGDPGRGEIFYPPQIGNTWFDMARSAPRSIRESYSTNYTIVDQVFANEATTLIQPGGGSWDPYEKNGRVQQWSLTCNNS